MKKLSILFTRAIPSIKRKTRTSFYVMAICIFSIYLRIIPISQSYAVGEIVLDYSLQTAVGSRYVFGGVGTPGSDHQIAWNLVTDSGVTMIRKEIRVEDELPSNISLADYKNNLNNVRDPNMWNKVYADSLNEVYRNAKSRNMKVMAVLNSAPAWLTYNGKPNGIPKDWAVYEDIVRKVYKLHRSYIDMVEVWNEPDVLQFFDVTGSGLTPNMAYAAIFDHASRAMRQVDSEINDGKRIVILATSAADPLNTRQLDYLLTTTAKVNLDGVSYHSYGRSEPSWSAVKTVLMKHGKGNLPIYVSEWAQTPLYLQNNPYTSTNKGVPYTAKKLIRFLKGGIAGAGYLSSSYFVATSTNRYMNSFGYYTIKDGVYSLLPPSKSWYLMSKTLGLGAGPSKIYKTVRQSSDSIEALAFQNSRSNKGFIIVNEGLSDATTNLSLKNLNLPYGTVAQMYIASDVGDGRGLYCYRLITASSPNFTVNIPWRSAVGVLFVDINQAYLRGLTPEHGYKTSKYCL